MPYPLSFADDFFCDGEPGQTRPSKRPTSVYQAILSLNDETWHAISHDVFTVEPEALDPLTVLGQVHRTSTCSNLDSPVRVWIDEDGWYDLLVFEP